MKQVPENCQACGLYKGCQTWKLPPEEDSRTHPALSGRPVQVVVVGKAPRTKDDLMARPFTDAYGGGKFLRQFLDQLEFRYVLTDAVRCFPGKDPDKSGDLDPTDEQIRLCNVFLREVLDRYKPLVVVALGIVAMKAAFWAYGISKVPRSIQAAAKTPLKVPDGPYVVTGYPPSLHMPQRKDRKDLRGEYMRMFEMVERVVRHGYDPPRPVVEIIRNPYHAAEIARTVPYGPVAVDVEMGTTDKDRNRMSIWHPDARLLCVSFAWKQMDGNYRSVVLFPPAMTKEIIELFVAGRPLVLHNAKYDVQALKKHADVDLHELSGTLNFVSR